MKRIFCLLLCFLLLCGCTGPDSADSPASQSIQRTEPSDPEQRLTYRRELAESCMRKMMSIRWKVPNAISYSATHNSKGMELDNKSNIVSILPNQIYQGMPYSHGGSSIYSFLSIAGEPDENGVYTLEGLTKELLSGYSGRDPHNTARLGNDCADAVFWSWAQVSSSITFPYTNCMVPAYGCIRVGDYDCGSGAYAGNTSEICSQNGIQRMYEAYACIEKADALVRTVNSAGHAIMAVSVHVVRLEDGTIDGDNSYVIYLDQDIACETGSVRYEDPAMGTVMLCEELDKQHTFAYLFQVGFLPVTCKELTDPAPLKEPTVTDEFSNYSLDNIFTGTITGSYRISYVQVEIADSVGNKVQDAICFGLQEDMYRFNLSRFTNEAEQRVIIGGIDIAKLPSGNYHCKFNCRLSTGDMITFRELEFAK